jgi:Fe-S-cluster containining protein
MFEIIPESGPLPLCARCARHQRTCCQDTDVFVTWGDIERIESHAGRNGFHEYRAPVNPDYLDQDDDPTWMRYVNRPDGTRRVLLQRSGGDCVFLGMQGCELPSDIRPLVCRLYPYDFDEAGIADAPAQGCPVQLLRPGRHLMEEMDMDLEEARQWHRQLYEEMKLEEPIPCESV